MGHLRNAVAGALALLLSATPLCAAEQPGGERLVFVGHWSESDPFFNVTRNSAQLAADQLGT